MTLLPTAPPVHVAGVDPAAPPQLRWTELTYDLPRPTATRRSAIWRRLVDVGGINLSPRRWALPHGPGGPPDVGPVRDLVDDAGGRIRAREVGDHQDADIESQILLRRTSEHLWDAFFNGADRLASHLARSPGRVEADHVSALDDLRRQYADLVGRDPLRTDAQRRAAEHLDHLTARVVPVEGPPATEGPFRVAVPAQWSLRGDQLRTVCRITPQPTAAWEQAMGRFEAFAYRPDPTRPPFRHGLVVFDAPPAATAEAVAGIEARLERAAAFLG